MVHYFIARGHDEPISPQHRRMDPIAAPTSVRVTNATRWKYATTNWTSLTRGSRSLVERHSLADRCAALQVSLNVPIVVSGPTAAELWDLPLPASVHYPHHPIEITLPMNSFHVRRPDVSCRRRELRSPMTTQLGDCQVITPAQLVVDLGRTMSLERLVAVGDAVLSKGLATRRDLSRALAMSTKRRGVVRARQAIEMLDPRAESPPESIVRAYLLGAGISVSVQREVFDAQGGFIGRVDLSIERERIAVEYDGAHHLSRAQQSDDARRRQRLEEAGWMVLTLNADDLVQPALMLVRVRSAIHSRTRTRTPTPTPTRTPNR